MLEELCHYLGVRTLSRDARLLGYAREMAALQVRHRRCREAWRPHLHATKQALLTAAQATGSRGGTALIVGGGCARDLPITELLHHFDKIVLLDIAFTWQTRCLAKRWPNRVFCHLYDVTGIVTWLARHRQVPPPTLVNYPPLPHLAITPRWVASVNCLTQLPLLPLDWLAKTTAEPRQLEAFGRAVIRTHVQWLVSWQVPVCLITEIEDQYHRSNGQLDRTDYRPILGSSLLPFSLQASWLWSVNPPGELANGAWEARTVAMYSM